MSSVEVAPGRVQALQIFFENLICRGYGSTKFGALKLDSRRPDNAAPTSILVKQRKQAFLNAIHSSTAPSFSSLQGMKSTEASRGTTVASHQSLLKGSENLSHSLFVGAANNGDVAARGNVVDYSAQKNHSQLLCSTFSNAFIAVKADTRLEAVESIVIDDAFVTADTNGMKAEELDLQFSSNENLSICEEVEKNSVSDAVLVKAGAQSPSKIAETTAEPDPFSNDNDFALFKARIIQDFVKQGVAELHAFKGDVVSAYEVNDDGWCLIKNGDDFGWIPQSFLEMVNDDSPNVGTPAKREIDFRYCIPRPEDRQAVMKFIEESSLFSEARAHGRVEVFTDMIDQILRGGRTLTGSLTTLLELDRNKRNFPNMQALVVSVQQLRNNWDALEDECREFLRQGAALLFANPATTLDPYQISQLVTGTTCGSEIIDRLREEIDLVHTGKPCNGFDELMAVISARQRSRSKARQVKLQAECQAVFLALRLPNLQLFSGFLDLRPNPVFQLLCNGMTADDIIATLESLAADQQTFSDLESMMIAVFKRGTGRDPSILCMGQGSPLARFSSVEDDDEEQKLNGLPAQQALQYKAKAIMTALSNPSIRLFSSVDSNISIKISDISALIQENPSLSSIICNIGLLNAQGRDLLTFAELISLQKDPSLMAAKQEIIDLIQQNVSAIFRHASDAQNMDIATIERLMNATHTHGTIKRILGIVIADDGKNYESLTELSAAIASIHIEQEKQREEETPRIVAWFQSHAIFTIEVELFDSTIDHLVELANGAQRLLQLLQSYEEHAVLFDSLEGLEESILSNIMPNKQLI